MLPGPLALSLPLCSLPPAHSCSSSDDRDVECAQEPAPCTPPPGPWWGPESSPEPSSPESESRGPGPRPSPVSSREGRPQPQGCHPSSIFPTWTLEPSCPSVLETDGAEPSSLEKEEAGEAPAPGEELKSEGPAGTTGSSAVQPAVHLTSSGG